MFGFFGLDSFLGKSNIKIVGTGTVVNGKTSLNINVKIDGPGGLGIVPQPGAGAGTTVPTQPPTTGQPIGTGAGTTVPTQGTTPPIGATTPGAGGGWSFALQAKPVAGYGFTIRPFGPSFYS